jgi:hypothetical protein
MGVRPRELRLVGYGGCDFTTGEPTFRPSEIIYSVHDDGRRHWLLRKEIHLDDVALHNHRTELVCAGVTRMDVRSLDEGADGSQTDTDAAHRQADTPITLSSVPDRLRVVLFGEQEGTEVLDEMVFLQ